MTMPTGNGKNLDNEWLKTPRMDCVLKVYKDKKFYQLGLQVC